MKQNLSKYSFALFALLRLTCILIPVGVSAQYFTIDTAKGDSPYNKEVSFIFPQLTSTVAQNSANEINGDLINNILQIQPGKQKESIFENIWGKKEMDIPAVGQLAFKVLNNDAEIFSISISFTACAEKCDAHIQYFNYESKTGRKIVLSDLLTGRGIQYLSDSVQLLKSMYLKEYTDTLKYAISKKPLSDDDKRDYNTAIGIYNNCIQAADPAAIFTIDKKQLTIHAGHCLPYELEFIDKADHDFDFEIGNLEPYLTDYGKALLH